MTDLSTDEFDTVDPDSTLAEELSAELTTQIPRRRRPWFLWFSIGWIVLIFLAAVFAGFLPLPAYDQSVGPARTPAFEQFGDGLILGTDSFGRSVLSRVVFGARASMLVGIVATGIGLLIGGFIGLISGYARGWTDRVSSFAVDTLLAFPPLVGLMTLTAVLRPRLSTLIIGLSVMVIPTFVRLQRAGAMAWAQRPFVLAARSYGSSHARIAFRQVLPNSIVTLVTYVPTVIAALIVAEGSLSFLGLGIPSPTPSWGGMIAEGRTQLRLAPQLVFVPAVFVFITILTFNLVGEHLRARIESRSRT